MFARSLLLCNMSLLTLWHVTFDTLSLLTLYLPASAREEIERTVSAMLEEGTQDAEALAMSRYANVDRARLPSLLLLPYVNQGSFVI